MRELASRYNVSLDTQLTADAFKQEFVHKLEHEFVSDWSNKINDHVKYPILRTYRKIKSNYQLEPYLYLVKNPKYRIAISRFRASSHMLEIERGRHTRPITPLDGRLCQ